MINRAVHRIHRSIIISEKISDIEVAEEYGLTAGHAVIGAIDNRVFQYNKSVIEGRTDVTPLDDCNGIGLTGHRIRLADSVVPHDPLPHSETGGIIEVSHRFNIGKFAVDGKTIQASYAGLMNYPAVFIESDSEKSKIYAIDILRMRQIEQSLIEYLLIIA